MPLVKQIKFFQDFIKSQRSHTEPDVSMGATSETDNNLLKDIVSSLTYEYCEAGQRVFEYGKIPAFLLETRIAWRQILHHPRWPGECPSAPDSLALLHNHGRGHHLLDSVPPVGHCQDRDRDDCEGEAAERAREGGGCPADGGGGGSAHNEERGAEAAGNGDYQQ